MSDPEAPAPDAAEVLAPVHTGEEPIRRRGPDYDAHGDRVLHEPITPVKRTDSYYARGERSGPGAWEDVEKTVPVQGSPVGVPADPPQDSD